MMNQDAHLHTDSTNISAFFSKIAILLLQFISNSGMRLLYHFGTWFVYVLEVGSQIAEIRSQRKGQRR